MYFGQPRKHRLLNKQWFQQLSGKMSNSDGKHVDWSEEEIILFLP